MDFMPKAPTKDMLYGINYKLINNVKFKFMSYVMCKTKK